MPLTASQLDFVVGYREYQTELWHNTCQLSRSEAVKKYYCCYVILLYFYFIKSLSSQMFYIQAVCCRLWIWASAPQFSTYWIYSLFAAVCALNSQWTNCNIRTLCFPTHSCPSRLSLFSAQMCVNNCNYFFASWGDERLMEDHKVVINSDGVFRSARCMTRSDLPKDISRAKPDVSTVKKWKWSKICHLHCCCCWIYCFYLCSCVFFLEFLDSADFFLVCIFHASLTCSLVQFTDSVLEF